MIRILFVMILFSMSCEGGGGSDGEIIYSTGGKKAAASLGSSPRDDDLPPRVLLEGFTSETAAMRSSQSSR